MPHRRRRRQPAAALALALVASGASMFSAGVASAAAATPRVMEFSTDGGTWSATSTKVDSSVLPAPTPLSIMGATALFGVSSDGHLIESSPDPEGSGQWLTTDLTTTAGVPTLRGSVSVLVDRADRVEVVARSSADHVVTVRSSPVPSGWTVTDLADTVGAPPIMSNPSATLGSHGGINVFYRTASSHLVGLIQHHRLSNGWWVRDLTKATGGPDVRGTPSAVTTPVDGASVSVAVRSSSGDLLLLADDNAHLTVWTSYDLSAETSSGTFSSNPTAVRAFGRLGVAAVRADGSLLVLSAPKASSHKFVAADLTSAAGTTGVEADTPASVVVGNQLEIAARTADRHLVVYSADPGSSYRGVTATDVSAVAAGLCRSLPPATPTATPTAVRGHTDRGHRQGPGPDGGCSGGDSHGIELQPLHRALWPGTDGRLPCGDCEGSVVLGLRQLGVAGRGRPDRWAERVELLLRRLRPCPWDVEARRDQQPATG